MNASMQDNTLRLAELQLPEAALCGIGNQLTALAKAMSVDEHLIRLATAHDGQTFGVLALTDQRVLWAAADQPGAGVKAWPRASVHPTVGDGRGCLQVDRDQELWKLDSVLPTDAAEALVIELSASDTAVVHA